jgi:beta-1,2-mannobiose phosphorylase / 1,2-beta-oligomannan phosphorylase
MKLQKHSENPILRPHPDHSWENLVVCNPGVIYDQGVFHMLYRAAGNDAEHVIHFGLATSTDGLNFERQSALPILSPSADGPDAGCIEDPRIVKLDGHFYITYAYRAHKPRQYWLQENNASYSPDDPSLPPLFGYNMTASGLLLSDDLRSFRRLGRITRPDVDDRDVILFPDKIGGRYAMLHRPMQWVGPEYGTKYPAIWLSFSDDLLSWSESSLLARGKEDWECKIGGSAPPIKTPQGWFVTYHAVDVKGVYRVGVMMLDLDDPGKVIARTPEPIMEPEEDFEWNGLYPHGVVFPTANVVVDDVIYVYYGCADQTIGVATAHFPSLVEFVMQFATASKTPALV